MQLPPPQHGKTGIPPVFFEWVCACNPSDHGYNRTNGKEESLFDAVLHLLQGNKVNADSRIIVALDVPTVVEATQLVEILKSYVAGFKVGLELQQTMLAEIGSALSPEVAATLAIQQWKFWRQVMGGYMHDGKFHDIPNTMRGAARAAALLRPRFMTIHASASSDGMRAALEGAGPSVEILAVTVLTSLGKECGNIFGAPAPQKVEDFADLAASVGVPGIVCSGAEVTLLHDVRPDITYVIPGVRSKGTKTQDQARVVTPAEAIQSGADYVVIGREITGDENPVQAAQRINADIATTLAKMGGDV